jgi:hypothetical protein
MKQAQSKKWWLVLAAYLLGGLTLGLADPLLGGWLAEHGIRRGLATAISVNLLMPLLAIGLASVCRRLAMAWLGSATLAGGFLLGLALVYPPPAAALPHFVSPVLVMACLGYAVLGSLTVLLARGMVAKSPSRSEEEAAS